MRAVSLETALSKRKPKAMKTALDQQRTMRRIWRTYFHDWIVFRLTIFLVFGAVMVYSIIRDTVNGSFRPEGFMLLLSILVSFQLIPFHVTRSMIQGWADIQKMRVSTEDISVLVCEVYPPRRRYQNLLFRIISTEGKRFEGYIVGRASFDGSTVKGHRLRISFFSRSRLIVKLSLLDPSPQKVKDQYKQSLLSPLLKQYQ